MRCHACGTFLLCALDCSNAPWNFDLPTTVPIGYLKRFVRWLRDDGGAPIPLPFRPDYWFTSRMFPRVPAHLVGQGAGS